ncbi:MAG: YciI family protein [Pseudomonadota bacterium]
MQYMLLIAANEAEEQQIPDAEMVQMIAAYGAYTEALIQAGALVSGERLRESTKATTVRVREGKTTVLDGPYAEAKEQLGGFYIIDVADLDAALHWAARCPGAAYGSIEVRPVWPTEKMSGDECSAAV